MMNYSISDACFMNMTLFWVLHIKRVVASMAVGFVGKHLMKTK